MKKLSIKEIIEFKRKSDRSKKSFAANLKLDNEKKDSDGGGNYWITSISAISNSFKTNDLQFISDKIYELEGKLENTENKRTKAMYERNIAILYKFEDFDFKKWKPSEKISLIKKHSTDSFLAIKGLTVQSTPHHVFTFKEDNGMAIGAIWFIAKLEGYRKDELGMFSDILFRYLKENFSEDYSLNPKYCIAVDVVNNNDVNYFQIQEGEVSAILNTTIDEIKKLM